jgi:hypothetical protein
MLKSLITSVVFLAISAGVSRGGDKKMILPKGARRTLPGAMEFWPMTPSIFLVWPARTPRARFRRASSRK